MQMAADRPWEIMGVDFIIISSLMPRSHQTFRSVVAVKLLGIMLRIRWWPTSFLTITAGDADGWYWNCPVWSAPQDDWRPFYPCPWCPYNFCVWVRINALQARSMLPACLPACSRVESSMSRQLGLMDSDSALLTSLSLAHLLIQHQY